MKWMDLLVYKLFKQLVEQYIDRFMDKTHMWETMKTEYLEYWFPCFQYEFCGILHAVSVCNVFFLLLATFKIFVAFVVM